MHIELLDTLSEYYSTSYHLIITLQVYDRFTFYVLFLGEELQLFIQFMSQR